MVNLKFSYCTSGCRNLANISCGHMDGVNAENGPPGIGRKSSAKLIASIALAIPASSSNPAVSSFFYIIRTTQRGKIDIFNMLRAQLCCWTANLQHAPLCPHILRGHERQRMISPSPFAGGWIRMLFGECVVLSLMDVHKPKPVFSRGRYTLCLCFCVNNTTQLQIDKHTKQTEEIRGKSGEFGSSQARNLVKNLLIAV